MTHNLNCHYIYQISLKHYLKKYYPPGGIGPAAVQIIAWVVVTNHQNESKGQNQKPGLRHIFLSELGEIRLILPR